MSATFRKNAKGDIEVTTVQDGTPVFIGRTFRMAGPHRVNIAQWFEPARRISWFALQNPCVTMINNMDSSKFFRFNADEDEETESYLTRYEGIVILQSEDIANSSEPSMYLTHLNGRILAGSNIYVHGKLCLGDGYNPLTVDPVELLMHNEANRDLGWRGDALEGEWIDDEFHISIWPTLEYHQKPPDAIIADIGRLWPT